jgi:hypothetical protein
MNDEDLKRRLRELPIPPASAERREETLHKARRALCETATEPARRETAWWPRLPWLGAGVCAAVAMLLVLLKPVTEPAAKPVDYARLFTEFEGLFPEQLEAVVSRGTQIDLQLAAVPGHASDQRLLLEFTRGAETIRVLAYSGRRVCVDLPTRVCFEALLTAEGSVVLSSDGFVWISGETSDLHGYRLTARPLPRSV